MGWLDVEGDVVEGFLEEGVYHVLHHDIILYQAAAEVKEKD